MPRFEDWWGDNQMDERIQENNPHIKAIIEEYVLHEKRLAYREALEVAIDGCIQRVRKIRDEFLMPESPREQHSLRLMERALDALYQAREDIRY